ncbi:MAG: peptidase prolyl oligopeptidase, partial [Phycisphaerales bacterium]|nr:peptidase prolyl oligopeptidase [Phycisphaerales bacterium]
LLRSTTALAAMLLAAAATPSRAADASLPASRPALTPPPNLVVDGVPPIPAAVAEDAGRFTEFRAASLAAWHPVRREVLVRTRFADTLQVHQVRAPLGARRQLTFFPDSVASATYPPSPDGKDPAYFLFAKDVGGSEFDQLYRYDLATGDATLLTDGRSKNGRPLFTKDGKRFVYTSTRRNRKDGDFYVADAASPADAKLAYQATSPGWSPIDWSPDGKTLLAGRFNSANESSLWLVDVATGKADRLTPESNEKVKYEGGAFAADGKGVYCTTDAGREFAALIYVDLATKQQTVLTPDLKWDVEDVALSDDGKTLAYVVNEAGTGALHLMDATTRQERPAPKLPPGQVLGLSFHANNRDLGFVLNSAKAPSDMYSADVTTGELTRWTESETAGLNTVAFPDPTLVSWKSFDRREISGFAYRPDPAKFPGKRPVIVNIHGGPESQFRPAFMGSYNYYFTRLGVAAVFPNVRGSNGYGKTFLTLDDGRKREDSVKDIGALLDWVKAQPDLDADRVLVTGGSYGGYMSLAVATHYADRIRCSVDVVGIGNFVTFLERTEPYRQDLRRVEYGDERDPSMREFLTTISPLTSVARIGKPMFVVHGANDPRVPVNEAEQMVAALKKQGTPVWSLVAKDEGHGFAKKANQQFQFYATIAYAREFLLK